MSRLLTKSCAVVRDGSNRDISTASSSSDSRVEFATFLISSEDLAITLVGSLGDITTSAFAVSTVSSNRRFLDKYFLISIHCVSDDGDDDDDDDEDEDEDDPGSSVKSAN